MELEVRKALLRNIRLVRMLNHLSQEEMAIEFSISRSCLSLYESGRRTPSIDFIYDFAVKFNLTIDELMEVDEKTFLKIYLSK